MKCWPGCASVASTTMWYIVTARASAARERSRAQLVGDLVEQLERLAEAPRELGLGGLQPAGDRAVAALDHLVHEALEEHRVARLVDLLGGEEVLLLLARRGVDERREVVGHRVLAVEEHRVVPQRGAALELGEPSCHWRRSSVKSISVARQLPRSQRAYRSVVGDLVRGHGAHVSARMRRSTARSSPPAPRPAPAPASSESRSRSVTVSSSSVWWSTVTAERRADLVLAPVALADVAALVVLGAHARAQRPRRSRAPSRGGRPCAAAAARRP